MARKLLHASPGLAREAAAAGATRTTAREYYFEEISHYLYEGDTALHIAAAGYRLTLAGDLLRHGAEPDARNRRGASPLHYATEGGPGLIHWDPEAQAAVIRMLIEAGADPCATDNDGVTPLHRACRNRCALAVRELLARGADPSARNKNGSTPAEVASRSTGRGGSGSQEARNQQREILQLLRSDRATPRA